MQFRFRSHLPRSLNIILLALLLNACRIPGSGEDAELVTSLRFMPSAFDSFKQNSELRYTLKKPATVNIRIIARDSTGREFLVNTLVAGLHESSGTHGHTWLGETGDGMFAPAGVYIGTLEANGTSYETVVRVYHQ